MPSIVQSAAKSIGRASGAESRPSFPFPLLNPVYQRNAKTTQQGTAGTPMYGTSALSNHRLDDKQPKLVYPSYSSVLSAAEASIAAEKATFSDKKTRKRTTKNIISNPRA